MEGDSRDVETGRGRDASNPSGSVLGVVAITRASVATLSNKAALVIRSASALGLLMVLNIGGLFCEGKDTSCVPWLFPFWMVVATALVAVGTLLFLVCSRVAKLRSDGEIAQIMFSVWLMPIYLFIACLLACLHTLSTINREHPQRLASGASMACVLTLSGASMLRMIHHEIVDTKAKLLSGQLLAESGQSWNDILIARISDQFILTFDARMGTFMPRQEAELDDHKNQAWPSESIPALQKSSEVETADFKLFCPICMLYYDKINYTSCCSNHICLTCTYNIRHVVIRDLGPLPDNVMQNCPFCNKYQCMVKLMAPSDLVLAYDYSPAAKVAIQRVLDKSPSSKLFESLRGKKGEKRLEVCDEIEAIEGPNVPRWNETMILRNGIAAEASRVGIPMHSLGNSSQSCGSSCGGSSSGSIGITPDSDSSGGTATSRLLTRAPHETRDHLPRSLDAEFEDVSDQQKM